MDPMQTPLSVIVSGGNLGSLVRWLVGAIIVAAIVYAILKACEAPVLLYKIAAVVGLVLLLLLTIDFFWGGGGNSIIR